MSTLDEIEAAIPALRRLARGLVRDRDAADDLVQDCLERAVAKRHLWRRDGPVETAGTPDEIVAAWTGKLDADYPPERLRTLIDNGGRT